MSSKNEKPVDLEAKLKIEAAPVHYPEMGYFVLPFVTVLQAKSRKLRKHIEKLQTKNGDHEPVGLVTYPDDIQLAQGQEILIRFQSHIWGSENECLVVQVL